MCILLPSVPLLVTEMFFSKCSPVFAGKSKGPRLPLASSAMEGLYFEVKPRGLEPPGTGSSDKPRPGSTPAHPSSRPAVCPEKCPSGSKGDATWGGKGDEEVQYKLLLIGSLPVHHLTTMAMLPWVVAEISKKRCAGLRPGRPGSAGQPKERSTRHQAVLLCVSASWVQCVSVVGDGAVWDPLTHTVLFECPPHRVTKLIHNSQEPSSFGCLIREALRCACYVFQSQDATKVSVCV